MSTRICLPRWQPVVMLLMMACMLQACIKDTVKHRYTFYRPVYRTKAEVRQQVKSTSPLPVKHPGKLFYKDGFVFLNEIEKGVHIIDIRQAHQPRVVAFIHIPGCIDLAVRNNTMYADLATDLVAIDISNPLDTKLTSVVENVFPHRYYGNYMPDTGQVIVDWVRVDTVVKSDIDISWGLKEQDFVFFTQGSLRANALSSGGGANGVGGSMARFALSNDRLYALGQQEMIIFNTANAAQPAWVKKHEMGAWDIETIFPYKDKLFIGSQTGMYIYDVSNKDNPRQLSKFEHARVCDPVVADDQYAYVTLRNGTQCMGFTNQLEIVNIANLLSPSLVKTYPMTNPHGLAVDGNILLICDGADGLRILDATNKQDVKQLSRIGDMKTYDVIALGGMALVATDKALVLVDYSNPSQPVITSSINTLQ